MGISTDTKNVIITTASINMVGFLFNSFIWWFLRRLLEKDFFPEIYFYERIDALETRLSFWKTQLERVKSDNGFSQNKETIKNIVSELENSLKLLIKEEEKQLNKRFLERKQREAKNKKS